MLFTSLHFLDFYNYMYLKFYPLDIFVPTRLEPTSNLLNIKNVLLQFCCFNLQRSGSCKFFEFERNIFLIF